MATKDGHLQQRKAVEACSQMSSFIRSTEAVPCTAKTHRDDEMEIQKPLLDEKVGLFDAPEETKKTSEQVSCVLDVEDVKEEESWYGMAWRAQVRKRGVCGSIFRKLAVILGLWVPCLLLSLKLADLALPGPAPWSDRPSRWLEDKRFFLGIWIYLALATFLHLLAYAIVRLIKWLPDSFAGLLVLRVIDYTGLDTFVPHTENNDLFRKHWRAAPQWYKCYTLISFLFICVVFPATQLLLDGLHSSAFHKHSD